MKQQIIIIRGGDSFKTHKAYIAFLKAFRIDIKRYASGKKEWKEKLGKIMGKNYEVVIPEMPNRMNARYGEWKMWFEKFVPHMRSGVLLVGHSLGGLFLVKYLSENTFPKKIRAVFLIAAPAGEGNFPAPKNIKKLEQQGGEIFLYHSIDDSVVPFRDFERYCKKLKEARIRTFSNRQHFNQEQFPELVRDIRGIV